MKNIVKKRKDNFHKNYSYLKPDSEKNGWEKFCDKVKSVGEWCKDHWKEIVAVIAVAIVAVVIAIFVGIEALIIIAALLALTGCTKSDVPTGDGESNTDTPTTEAPTTEAPTGEALSKYELGDKYETDDFYYLRAIELLSEISSTDSKYDKELQHFKELYLKYEDRYKAISEKTGVPPELIAAIHYHENAGDFDWENGVINFSVYLHNGQKLGETTTMAPADVYFGKDEFNKAAIDALEGKYWSQVENTPSEHFKSNNQATYNATGLKDGNNSLIAMLTFAERYNGANKDKISTYVYNGALDSSGNNIPGSGKYTSDGNYDPNAENAQPGVYLLLNAIIDVK